mmetsp:Transcript_26338/g.88534  ORF Transcript_26338/g.88534 Transcript_26338/m.88534 type:complete len:264 (-) Transcript_26338:198-989(-)
MVMKHYKGVMGALYTVYLLVVGLNLTCVWFAVKKVLATVFPGRVSIPTHRDFLTLLMGYLAPVVEILGEQPSLVDSAGKQRGFLVLCNHVNWSDFVLDIVFVDKGVYVSRSILKLVFFPGSLLRSWLYDDMIYFKRGGKSEAAKKASNAYLYEQVVKKCDEGRSVIVYAEGTRNPEGKRMPLRVGLIKLAYERKIPVYVSMLSNKPLCFDERRGMVTTGVPVKNKKSRVLEPTAFPDLPAFIDACQKEWDALWFELIDPPAAR